MFAGVLFGYQEVLHVSRGSCMNEENTDVRECYVARACMRYRLFGIDRGIP